MQQTANRNYLLVVLLAVLSFNYVDRLALGLVLQQIKTDLALTDTQLGFLTGIAFALFYSIAGIPIARWADRGNRVAIIALTLALSMVMIALSSTATTFAQLVVLRIGVAVGEAGCVPAAQSLIADHFGRAERARAVSIYMLGGSLGVVMGYLVAGWLGELYGWRAMFLSLSLPGVVIAALAWFTLKEPRTANDASPAGLAMASPGLWQVVTTLWANATFRDVLLCFSVITFFGYGIAKWQPAFFVRSYGLNTGELGTWLAAIHGVGGFIGIYLGGTLASRYAARNERLQLAAMGLLCAGLAVLTSLIYLARSFPMALAFMGLAAVGGSMLYGPLHATVQSLVPEQMRAMAIAIIFLFSNLIGMGLGPLAAGALSDTLRPAVGEESLRYALVALCPGYFLGGWLLWRGRKTVMRDIADAETRRAG
jgi:MFS transporter, Spinster family, sphingosine-1-phosphate transporter